MTTTTDTRALDAWLAEHLFGLAVEELPFFYDPENGVPGPRWDRFIHDMGEPDGTGPFVNVRRSEMGTYTQVHADPLAAYSTTGDGMLAVMIALAERGLEINVSAGPGRYGGVVYEASVDGPCTHGERAEDGSIILEPLVVDMQADTLPLAVARAAAAALSQEASR